MMQMIRGVESVPLTTAQIEAAADDLVEAITDQYRRSWIVVGFSPDEALRMAFAGPILSLIVKWTDWFKTENQKRNEKALEDLWPLIEKWKTTYRSWASNGHREDGTSYTWARWFEFAKDTLASQMEFTVGESWDSSIAANFIQTLKEAGHETSDCVVHPIRCFWDKAPQISKIIVGAVVVITTINLASSISRMFDSGTRLVQEARRPKLNGRNKRSKRRSR